MALPSFIARRTDAAARDNATLCPHLRQNLLHPPFIHPKRGWHGLGMLLGRGLAGITGVRLRHELIMAIIKPFKLDDVREALIPLGVQA